MTLLLSLLIKAWQANQITLNDCEIIGKFFSFLITKPSHTYLSYQKKKKYNILHFFVPLFTIALFSWLTFLVNYCKIIRNKTEWASCKLSSLRFVSCRKTWHQNFSPVPLHGTGVIRLCVCVSVCLCFGKSWITFEWMYQFGQNFQGLVVWSRPT